MADHTGIEWADATWNPVLGCDRVSKGCDFCYAITTANIRKSNPNEAVADAYAGLVQLTNRGLDWTGRVNLIESRLTIPTRWRKPRKIFVNSQSDLFHKDVTDEFIAKVFAVMAATPRHTYQILTKRHGRMKSLLNSPDFRDLVARAVMDLPVVRVSAMQWPLPNVWLGVSVEDQGTADLRIPALLGTRAAVRWLSMEPLLGPVDLRRSLGRHFPHSTEFEGRENLRYADMLHWVVVGGETGRGRIRPMHPDWARGLRDQCQDAGIPFFFKQWGDMLPVPVVDRPDMFGGRAIQRPGGGGWSAVHIMERGPSGTMRNATSRAMVPGDRTKGGTVMLDLDTVAVRVGKAKAGRELDGRTWDEFPEVARAGA